jgi:hypothetical protein
MLNNGAPGAPRATVPLRAGRLGTPVFANAYMDSHAEIQATVRRRSLSAMRPDELERRLRERLDALRRRLAPSFSTSSCSRTSTAPMDRRVLGLPGESRLRRAADRLRGGSGAPSGAGRDAAGGGLSEGGSGLHTAEVETINGRVSGIGVHIGARVGSMAKASEVLVSSTVKDLVAGSGLVFENAGEHELKGVPDRWRFYRVAA